MRKFKLVFFNQAIDEVPVFNFVRETKCYINLQKDNWSYRVHKKTLSVKMVNTKFRYGIDLIHASYLKEIL